MVAPSYRLRILIVAALLIGLFSAWWHFPSATRLIADESIASAFAEAETWEVLSLEPWKGDFYGHRVLDRTTIGDEEVKRSLVRAFNRSTRGWHNALMMCFNPRHVLSATDSGGRRVDLLICFECLSYKALENGKAKLPGGQIRGTLAAEFNRIYGELGLKVASTD